MDRKVIMGGEHHTASRWLCTGLLPPGRSRSTETTLPAQVFGLSLHQPKTHSEVQGPDS